ncbi:MAG TPA: hypothetical protein VEL28_03905 [Candidatus Binatia bacterium]|nr:hypothetical protein [Candidatus Binatia bacterium]
MAIYHVSNDRIEELPATSFAEARVREREDLQALIRRQIEIVAHDVLVIAEEFCEWEDSRRRIDLLAVDREANLVVIELKRTADGGHMELQAIRYAAMVSAMTFDRAVEVYAAYLGTLDEEEDARAGLLKFLDWEEPDEDAFGQTTRIILVAADFSRELTTAVMWLNEHDLDIRCVRLKPYRDGERLMLDVQQVIPLPEAADYQIQIRAKQQQERRARTQKRDFTKYDVRIGSQRYEALAKRNAIFAIVRHLCTLGHAPESIAAAVPWRPAMFWSCAGHLDADAFAVQAVKEATEQGRRFDPRRSYISDSELIHSNGKTYAFTKMWGARTAEAMNLLHEAFPDADFDFVESDD